MNGKRERKRREEKRKTQYKIRRGVEIRIS